jgi:hypothetical protein
MATKYEQSDFSANQKRERAIIPHTRLIVSLYRIWEIAAVSRGGQGEIMQEEEYDGRCLAQIDELDRFKI